MPRHSWNQRSRKSGFDDLPCAVMPRGKANQTRSLSLIHERIVMCTRCPELREYCESVARSKRKSFADWNYWGKPVPSFGDCGAKIMIVGLAPAAHGANRTGRMFTGDRSGDFLYAALHRAGLANQEHSTHAEDGLQLKQVYITGAAHCAPPANKPTPLQLWNCRSFLAEEIRIMQPRVILALGAIAWNAALAAMQENGTNVPQPRPKFAHGADVFIDGINMLGCYHVSQQNTFTGRLTPEMLDVVLRSAIRHAQRERRERYTSTRCESLSQAQPD
jgi:uracil-DNA glycosylase